HLYFSITVPSLLRTLLHRNPLGIRYPGSLTAKAAHLSTTLDLADLDNLTRPDVVFGRSPKCCGIAPIAVILVVFHEASVTYNFLGPSEVHQDLVLVLLVRERRLADVGRPDPGLLLAFQARMTAVFGQAPPVAPPLVRNGTGMFPRPTAHPNNNVVVHHDIVRLLPDRPFPSGFHPSAFLGSQRRSHLDDVVRGMRDRARLLHHRVGFLVQKAVHPGRRLAAQHVHHMLRWSRHHDQGTVHHPEEVDDPGRHEIPAFLDPDHHELLAQVLHRFLLGRRASRRRAALLQKLPFVIEHLRLHDPVEHPSGLSVR